MMGQTHGVNFFVDFLFCFLDTSSFFRRRSVEGRVQWGYKQEGGLVGEKGIEFQL